MNHPRLLAFGYTYLPQGASETSYAVLTTSFLSGFKAMTANLHSVVLRDVHNVSAEDGHTITDLIWKLQADARPYEDSMADNSLVFAQMDSIAHGASR